MFQLSNIGIKAEEVVFTEKKAVASAMPQIIESLKQAGYSYLGKHLSKDITLMHSDSDYILINASQSDSSESIGVLVDNSKSLLSALWGRKGVDVFEGGIVGELSLHLNAIRLPSGQLVYLIDKQNRDDFFITDFNY